MLATSPIFPYIFFLTNLHFNHSFSSSGDMTYKCKVDNEEFNTSEVIKTLDTIQPKACITRGGSTLPHVQLFTLLIYTIFD